MSNDLLKGIDVKETMDDYDPDYIPEGMGFVWDSGIYDVIIEHARLLDNPEKARGIAFKLKLQNSNNELDVSVYYTSGEKKGFKTYYIRKDDKENKPIPIPGYTIIEELIKLVGKESFDDLTTREVEMELYNHEMGKETMQKVKIINEFHGKPVSVALVKELANKFINGKPISETKHRNNIVKFLYKTNDEYFTYSEVKNKSESKWSKKWLKNNEGKIIDKTDKKLTPGTSISDEDFPWD